MTNKELAVQIYTALLNANAAVFSNPNFGGTAGTPSFDTIEKEVADLTARLSRIKDN